MCVEEWLFEVGVEPTAAVEVVHERPWSTVMRVPAEEGDLFLKQEGLVQEYEVPLTVALAKRWPDRMPEVLAADMQRAWLLLRDGGTRIGDSLQFDAFPEALRLYGELQVAEVEHADAFLAMGVPDVRLPIVSAAYEPFFERDHGLEPEEVARLRALAPRFRELCDELASFGLPDSIQHDDLHEWNVFVRDGRVGIYDWGDSSVAFPLWSWLKPLRATGYLGLDAEPLRAAYLEPWLQVAPEQRLEAALKLAIPTGLFAYALQIRRQYDATQAHAEYQAYLPENLRRLLEALDAV